MMKKYDVITVGMINFDVNARGFEKDMPGNKLSILPEISISLGGDAENCALSLARMGIKTAICGMIGNDLAGDICVSELTRNGVDPQWIKRSSLPTPIAINLVTGIECPVLYNEGAGIEFSLEDIPQEAFSACKIMSLNSFFGCGKIGKEFFKTAKQHNIVTIADTTTLNDFNKIEDIESCFEYIDYFLPSYKEAATLTQNDNPESIAKIFMEKGCKNIAIKLGADGCFIQSDNEMSYHKGFSSKVVDTTGCGDNFVAGFIAALLHGYSFADCANIANAAGAINAQYLGSNGAVHSFQQLLDFI
ncbi:MAG: carbohydrate kinase family protein [Flexilinea sp.]